jgi:hypothetical protein
VSRNLEGRYICYTQTRHDLILFKCGSLVTIHGPIESLQFWYAISLGRHQASGLHTIGKNVGTLHTGNTVCTVAIVYNEVPIDFKKAPRRTGGSMNEDSLSGSTGCCASTP